MRELRCWYELLIRKGKSVEIAARCGCLGSSGRKRVIEQQKHSWARAARSMVHVRDDRTSSADGFFRQLAELTLSVSILSDKKCGWVANELTGLYVAHLSPATEWTGRARLDGEWKF
jgi:hypothetical protein